MVCDYSNKLLIRNLSSVVVSGALTNCKMVTPILSVSVGRQLNYILSLSETRCRLARMIRLAMPIWVPHGQGCWLSDCLTVLIAASFGHDIVESAGGSFVGLYSIRWCLIVLGVLSSLVFECFPCLTVSRRNYVEKKSVCL